jgi:Xaa-Pro aminopeptidase
MNPIGFDKKRASEIMQSVGVDVLVASSPENVFYTSGMPVRHAEVNPILFASSKEYPSIVVIDKNGEEALITWQQFTRVDKVSWIKNVAGIISRDEALQKLRFLIENMGLTRHGTIGIESLMPYYQSCWLTGACPETKIRMSDDLFIEMRLEKSEEEIRRISESARIAEKTIMILIEFAKEGASAAELVKTAKKSIIEEGASGFDHINVGLGGSDPRYPGKEVTMKRTDLARFNIGAVYEGYSSSVRRNASIVTPPVGEETTHKLMLDVQQACVNAIKPGVEPTQVIEAAEEKYKKDGGEGFFFVTINSLGIIMNEYTFYRTSVGPSSRPFSKNNVITVECWTTFPSQGNIGIEDMYLVTESGCKEISTLERKIYTVGGGRKKR